MKNLFYKVSVSPEQVFVSNRVTVKISIELCDDVKIKPGGAVKLRVHGRHLWPIFQSNNPKQDYVEDTHNTQVNTEGKVLRIKKHCCYTVAYLYKENRKSPIRLNIDCFNDSMTGEIIALLGKNEMDHRDKLQIVMGDKSGGGKGCVLNHISQEINFYISVDFEANENFIYYGEPLVLKKIPQKASSFAAVVSSTFNSEFDKVNLFVKALDKHKNVAENFNKEIEIRELGTKEYSGKLELKNGLGNIEIPVSKCCSKDILSFRVKDKTGTLKAKSNISVKQNDNLKLFWGDIHGHTSFSASQETPDFYFRYARDIAKLDFVSCPENDSLIIDRKLHSLPQGPFWNTRESAWAIVKYMHSIYNKPGKFVTILGYEWCDVQRSSPRTSLPYGHKNVYYLDDDGPIFSHTDGISDNPVKLWALLNAKGAITIPHHPAYPLERRMTGTDWRFHDGRFQRLVEIYSKHGMSEYYGNPKPLIRCQKGNFVQDALARGYRLGFTAGSDTHIGRPGSDMEENAIYFQETKGKSGLTAVYAEELTRTSIFKALYERRCYATTGERIFLKFSLNDFPMGSEILLERESKPDIKIEVHGTEKIKEVSIINNGKTFFKDSPGKQSVSYDLKGKKPKDNDYYYVRVVQEDEETAWSSPIWINF
ncbi:DUF3604 domain-containing protein [bacterium]|nr:DUF3604 domain-containing protein [bacterium]